MCKALQNAQMKEVTENSYGHTYVCFWKKPCSFTNMQKTDSFIKDSARLVFYHYLSPGSRVNIKHFLGDTGN